MVNSGPNSCAPRGETVASTNPLPGDPRARRGGPGQRRHPAELQGRPKCCWHFIAALRCLYRHAAADGLISEADNPARKVAKPRPLPGTRHALPDARFAEINEVAATTGNDPALDALLLRLTETACRRGGALALRLGDLDIEQCLIRLREKGDTSRWQPVSPTLMRHLIAHHEQCADCQPQGQLLRSRNGRALIRRRYDYLWTRLGKHLPWVAAQQISTHWLRHTTLTWVERNFGYAVARAYAGHTGSTDGGTTSTYIRADVREVAVALATLTGEDHPLRGRAGPGRRTGDCQRASAAARRGAA